MKTKSRISGYILRSSAATLLLSCMIVALSWAMDSPSHPPKLPVPQNNTVFGVNAHESVSSLAASAIRNRTLTFADRVAYQRAIEEVYWGYRIWPKENASPKPPLDAVMSQTEIQKKVEDYLRNSQLLEDSWHRPITAERLQTEMDRMAQHTKRPEVLRELFKALGNDPFIIAECLARPVLAERSLPKLYGRDKNPSGSPLTNAENWVASAMITQVSNYTLPEIVGGGCVDDTWTATSTTNAPDSRHVHTAVWTGSEMIVWGGFDSGAYTNTGGRYDPATDSWTATSTTNAPDARDLHTAVWTGSRMIVWGGMGFFGDLQQRQTIRSCDRYLDGNKHDQCA